MSTTVTSPSTPTSEASDVWSSFFARVVPILAIVGPALGVFAALFVAFQVQMLPADLNWISEPESFFFYLGAIAFPATWIVIGRAISRRAARTGVAVTVLGVLGAFTGTSAAAWRHMSIDLVEQGVDPTLINQAWEDPTLYSALATVVTFPAFFVVPIIAGIAILKTRLAPVWVAVALISFGPTLMAAQGFYAATEVTYPVAWALMLAGTLGVLRAERTDRPRQ